MDTQNIFDIVSKKIDTNPEYLVEKLENFEFSTDIKGMPYGFFTEMANLSIIESNLEHSSLDETPSLDGIADEVSRMLTEGTKLKEFTDNQTSDLKHEMNVIENLSRIFGIIKDFGLLPCDEETIRIMKTKNDMIIKIYINMFVNDDNASSFLKLILDHGFCDTFILDIFFGLFDVLEPDILKVFVQQDEMEQLWSYFEPFRDSLEEQHLDVIEKFGGSEFHMYLES